MTMEDVVNHGENAEAPDVAAPASGAPAPRLFRRLHHVCIVVEKLEPAVAYFESLGVGPWYDYPHDSPYVELSVPDPEATKAMRYKCTDFDNVQLQLCEPSEHPSPQRAFLDTRGPGVYHLGFLTEDLTGAMEAAQSLGLDRISHGIREDDSGFCYFDTERDAGVVLEVRK